MSTKLSNVKFLKIPKIKDVRGNLSVIEGKFLPFDIKRVYYLYDVPSRSVRGGHAHIKLYQFLVPLSGSFDVILKDGENEKRKTLNRPDEGLLITPGIWRELDNFSSGSVCLVVASEVFDESDYIRDYKEFLEFKNKTTND